MTDEKSKRLEKACQKEYEKMFGKIESNKSDKKRELSESEEINETAREECKNSEMIQKLVADNHPDLVEDDNPIFGVERHKLRFSEHGYIVNDSFYEYPPEHKNLSLWEQADSQFQSEEKGRLRFSILEDGLILTLKQAKRLPKDDDQYDVVIEILEELTSELKIVIKEPKDLFCDLKDEIRENCTKTTLD